MLSWQNIFLTWIVNTGAFFSQEKLHAQTQITLVFAAFVVHLSKKALLCHRWLHSARCLPYAFNVNINLHVWYSGNKWFLLPVTAHSHIYSWQLTAEDVNGKNYECFIQCWNQTPSSEHKRLLDPTIFSVVHLMTFITVYVPLCLEYYPNCEVMFMGMANIHAIRNSFQALRTVCSQIPDPGK